MREKGPRNQTTIRRITYIRYHKSGRWAILHLRAGHPSSSFTYSIFSAMTFPMFGRFTMIFLFSCSPPEMFLKASPLPQDSMRSMHAGRPSFHERSLKHSFESKTTIDLYLFTCEVHANNLAHGATLITGKKDVLLDPNQAIGPYSPGCANFEYAVLKFSLLRQDVEIEGFTHHPSLFRQFERQDEELRAYRPGLAEISDIPSRLQQTKALLDARDVLLMAKRLSPKLSY
ncbi:hypothetical protein F5050DRAFT_815504 [Lentinula boryana]|uniref:Uncharacterized protein n=1 Tax=Lentinula boryana TaxID=40481 RepID=A0ABQ8QMD8_9AGAR|nr:hypothetical protein F5050DRAFT_815504 [Lentinula boryana]